MSNLLVGNTSLSQLLLAGDNAVSLSAGSISEEMTIEAWFQIEQQGCLFSLHSEDAKIGSLTINNVGSFSFSSKNNEDLNTQQSTYATNGSWHHIVLRLSGGSNTQSIILDGQTLVESKWNWPVTDNDSEIKIQTVYVGINELSEISNNNNLSASVSCVRIWNDIRSNADINDNKFIQQPIQNDHIAGLWVLDGTLNNLSGGSTAELVNTEVPKQFKDSVITLPNSNFSLEVMAAGNLEADNQYYSVNTQGALNLEEFSIALWIKADETGGNLISLVPEGGDPSSLGLPNTWALSVNNNNLEFCFGLEGKKQTIVIDKLVPGQWHRVLLNRVSDEPSVIGYLSCFINGKFGKRIPVITPVDGDNNLLLFGPGQTTEETAINSLPKSTGQGSILFDEVAIWNTVQDPQQDLINANLTYVSENSTDLVGYWNFDLGCVIDQSKSQLGLSALRGKQGSVSVNYDDSFPSASPIYSHFGKGIVEEGFVITPTNGTGMYSSSVISIEAWISVPSNGVLFSTIREVNTGLLLEVISTDNKKLEIQAKIKTSSDDLQTVTSPVITLGDYDLNDELIQIVASINLADGEAIFGFNGDLLPSVSFTAGEISTPVKIYIARSDDQMGEAFTGKLGWINIWQNNLSEYELALLQKGEDIDNQLIANWQFAPYAIIDSAWGNSTSNEIKTTNQMESPVKGNTLNYAINIDQKNSYATQIDTIESNSEWLLQTWLYARNQNSNTSEILTLGDDESSISIRVKDELLMIVFSTDDEDIPVDSVIAFPFDSWVNIAVTANDEGSFSLYLNGIPCFIDCEQSKFANFAPTSCKLGDEENSEDENEGSDNEFNVDVGFLSIQPSPESYECLKINSSLFEFNPNTEATTWYDFSLGLVQSLCGTPQVFLSDDGNTPPLSIYHSPILTTQFPKTVWINPEIKVNQTNGFVAVENEDKPSLLMTNESSFTLQCNFKLSPFLSNTPFSSETELPLIGGEDGVKISIIYAERFTGEKQVLHDVSKIYEIGGMKDEEEIIEVDTLEESFTEDQDKEMVYRLIANIPQINPDGTIQDRVFEFDSVNIDTGKWYSTTLTFDTISQLASLYLNSNGSLEEPKKHIVDWVFNSGSSFYIGNTMQSDFLKNQFSGGINEIRVWDACLDKDSPNLDLNVPVKDKTNLVANWAGTTMYKEGSNLIMEDLTLNQHTARLNLDEGRPDTVISSIDASKTAPPQPTIHIESQLIQSFSPEIMKEGGDTAYLGRGQYRTLISARDGEGLAIPNCKIKVWLSDGTVTGEPNLNDDEIERLVVGKTSYDVSRDISANLTTDSGGQLVVIIEPSDNLLASPLEVWAEFMEPNERVVIMPAENVQAKMLNTSAATLRSPNGNVPALFSADVPDGDVEAVANCIKNLSGSITNNKNDLIETKKYNSKVNFFGQSIASGLTRDVESFAFSSSEELTFKQSIAPIQPFTIKFGEKVTFLQGDESRQYFKTLSAHKLARYGFFGDALRWVGDAASDIIDATTEVAAFAFDVVDDVVQIAVEFADPLLSPIIEALDTGIKIGQSIVGAITQVLKKYDPGIGNLVEKAVQFFMEVFNFDEIKKNLDALTVIADDKVDYYKSELDKFDANKYATDLISDARETVATSLTEVSNLFGGQSIGDAANGDSKSSQSGLPSIFDGSVEIQSVLSWINDMSGMGLTPRLSGEASVVMLNGLAEVGKNLGQSQLSALADIADGFFNDIGSVEDVPKWALQSVLEYTYNIADMGFDSAETILDPTISSGKSLIQSYIEVLDRPVLGDFGGWLMSTVIGLSGADISAKKIMLLPVAVTMTLAGDDTVSADRVSSIPHSQDSNGLDPATVVQYLAVSRALFNIGKATPFIGDLRNMSIVLSRCIAFGMAAGATTGKSPAYLTMAGIIVDTSTMIALWAKIFEPSPLTGGVIRTGTLVLLWLGTRAEKDGDFFTFKAVDQTSFCYIGSNIFTTGFKVNKVKSPQLSLACYASSAALESLAATLLLSAD